MDDIQTDNICRTSTDDIRYFSRYGKNDVQSVSVPLIPSIPLCTTNKLCTQKYVLSCIKSMVFYLEASLLFIKKKKTLLM